MAESKKKTVTVTQVHSGAGRYAGRDSRLTDVYGQVVRGLVG